MAIRFLLCGRGINGFLSACWHALDKRSEVNLSVIAFRSRGGGFHHDFDDGLARGLACHLLDAEEREDVAHVASLARDVKPDVILIPGWTHKPYSQLVRNKDFASTKFMMQTDTSWWNTWRQRWAWIKIGRYLARMDRVLVPGERGWQAARNFGVPDRKICRGAAYAIDYAKYEPVLQERIQQSPEWPGRFLYVGRLLPQKGIDVLVDAYRDYRRQVSEPWPLTTCGIGPLQHLIDGVEGIDDRGFVQPDDLADVFRSAGVFVIASRHEPWCAAIAEAVASGLPVICTEQCGVVVDLVLPYYNGVTVPCDDAGSLTKAMLWMHEHRDRLPEMGRSGQPFAAGYSAEAWAERIVNILQGVV